MTEKKPYDIIDKEEPRGQSVTWEGIPCTARTCVTRLNRLTEENEKLKKAYTQLEHRHSLLHDVCIDAECDRDSYRKDVASLEKENEKLKKALDDFKAYDDEEFKETEHINSIYKKEGFTGVINYAKDKLQYYGVVKEVEKGLWVMVTGGWSDNEYFIHCLNNLISNFGRKHYSAYEKGGAFYYTEEPHADVEISLKKESRE